MSQSPNNTEKQEHSEDVDNDRRKDGGKSGREDITERIVGPES